MKTTKPPTLIDVGVNLSHKQFAEDLDDVISRALAAGVQVLIATGTDQRGSEASLALARRYPGQIYTTCGIHPHNATSAEHSQRLPALARCPEVVAVGECGLDFDRDFSPRAVQERAFASQIELAIEVGKPLFLHERAARERFTAILDGYGGKGALPVPAVVHCFTGTADAARAYLDRGFYLGITGWVCDDRRNKDLLRALPLIPLDRILLETDAPFLRPPGLLGPARRNEPANLVHVCRRVATVLRKTPAAVAAATTENAARFFKLPAEDPEVGKEAP